MPQANRRHVMKSLIRRVTKQSVLRPKNDTSSDVTGSYWLRSSFDQNKLKPPSPARLDPNVGLTDQGIEMALQYFHNYQNKLPPREVKHKPEKSVPSGFDNLAAAETCSRRASVARSIDAKLNQIQ